MNAQTWPWAASPPSSGWPWPHSSTSRSVGLWGDYQARERYADSGGLYLEALPAGGKHWRWKYRIGGKEKRLAIGTYPAVTLAQARQARDDARKKLMDGVDPVQAKLDARLAVRMRVGTTFEAVARAWFEPGAAQDQNAMPTT